MKRKILVILLTLLALVAVPVAALADEVPSFDFATPLFGLDVAPDGSLLVADSGSGVVELRKGTGSVVMELPGVADIAAIGRGAMFDITGGAKAIPPASFSGFRVEASRRSQTSLLSKPSSTLMEERSTQTPLTWRH